MGLKGLRWLIGGMYCSGGGGGWRCKEDGEEEGDGEGDGDVWEMRGDGDI
jgi:hypothetical protein